MTLPPLAKSFSADFDTITAGLLPKYKGPPYAFARYADGEAAIIGNGNHTAKADGWRTDGRFIPWTRSNLIASLTCHLPGWRIGITAQSCHEADHSFLLALAGAADRDITFAEIFMLANWDRFAALDLSACRFVGAGADSMGSRGFAIPPDAVERDDFDTSPAVRWMMAGSGPILLAAGPLAKIIAWEYWRATAASGVRRDVCVDAGSAMSPMLRGRRTRRYHWRNNEARKVVPTWKAGG